MEPSRTANSISSFLPRFDWESIPFTHWSEILHDLTFRRRQNLIEDLPKLAPAILHYGNEDTLREVVTVMEEVCEQWR